MKRTQFKRNPDAKQLSRGSGLARQQPRRPNPAGATGSDAQTEVEKRYSTLSRGKPLAQVSPQRQAENDGPWLETKRIVNERDRGVCQIRRFYPDHRCSFGRHPHHVWPVGCGGDRLDPDGIATVCWSGHDWVHNGIGWQAFKTAWDGRE